MDMRGTVVQLPPDFELNKAFAGCFFVIKEKTDTKVLGYVQCLGDNREEMGGQAYLFLNEEQLSKCHYVGEAAWIVE